jgi:hypothetical protein
MDHTSWVESGEALDGVASTDAVIEVNDILVGTCDRHERDGHDEKR